METRVSFKYFVNGCSQRQGEFEKFSNDLELNLGTLSQKNPFLVVAIGDFNPKSKRWYINDSTNSQGNVLEKYYVTIWTTANYKGSNTYSR